MNFKIDDIVKVVKKANPSNWYNLWVAPMDDFIGQTYTISRIVPHGIYFKENKLYGFPEESLVLVSEYIQPTKEDLVLKKIKLLWNTSNWVKQNPQRAY